MINRVKRLLGMRPAEVLQALSGKSRIPLLRTRFDLGLIKPLPDDLVSIISKGSPLEKTLKERAAAEHTPEKEVLSYYLAGGRPLFYSFAGAPGNILSVLQIQMPGRIKDTLERADRICEHKFRVFGAEYELRSPLNWSMDFTTGKEWPLSFYTDIPYRDRDRTGDIKYPWELSRHQYFITLGKAYLYSGDEKYAREFVDQTVSWIDSNPLCRGIHWISPLETAIRVISWIWAYHFFRGSPAVTPEFFSLFVRSLWVQLGFIEKNLTQSRYANNHLIGEAAGLFVGGMFLEGFKGALNWSRTGREILLREIAKQTHPDGANVEQAMNYQRFVMDFFLLFRILHEQNIGPLPAETDDRLEKMFEFLMYMIRPDGSMPPYGDSDNARGITLSEEDNMDCRDLLSVGAVLFNRGDMKRVSQRAGEEVVWFLGTEGMDRYEKIRPAEPGSRSVLFRDGGYGVLRSGWDEGADYLLFDCGPLGYRSGAHGHADALGIQMFCNGGEVLVDPGTFAYNLEPEYRDYFRSTSAHNTVSVDGRSQAEIADRMSWEAIPEAVVNDCYFSDELDLISAEHNGYKRFTHPVAHSRTIISSRTANYYILLDRLVSSGPHEYALHFHFPPGSALNGEGPHAVRIPSAGNLLLDVKSTAAISCAIEEGSDAGPDWYSRRYGRMESSPSLTFKCAAGGMVFFYSLLVPFKETPPLLSSFNASTGGEAACLTVEKDGTKDIWFINGGDIKAVHEGISFTGRTALIRRQAGDGGLSAYVRDATCLHIDEKTRFESQTRMNGCLLKNKTVRDS